MKLSQSDLPPPLTLLSSGSKHTFNHDCFYPPDVSDFCFGMNLHCSLFCFFFIVTLPPSVQDFGQRGLLLNVLYKDIM